MKLKRSVVVALLVSTSTLAGCDMLYPPDSALGPGQPGEPDEPGSPADPEDQRPNDPDTSTSTDVFGVRQLYPSKPGGESWFLSDDPNRDPRFDPQDTVTQNEDGSWKMASDKVRMNVFTSSGYNSVGIRTLDREHLAEQGFMLSENDWKNVEITGYVKLNEASDLSDNFCWYARGGRHNDAQPCEGCAYKGDLHYDGRARFGKESWHVSYEYVDYKEATEPLLGRWVGIKTVIRNTTVDGKPAVRMELWVDDQADKVSWKKVHEYVDDGSWGGDSAECGARNAAMPLVWGGPVVTYRWDNAEDVDFKWLSVREIEP